MKNRMTPNIPLAIVVFAAQSKTAATAAKTTLASGMFGAIRFLMAHLLRYELRSLQSCLACWAGLPGTYDVVNSGCRRRPKWQTSSRIWALSYTSQPYARVRAVPIWPGCIVSAR